jgi:hypothetical protein
MYITEAGSQKKKKYLTEVSQGIGSNSGPLHYQLPLCHHNKFHIAHSPSFQLHPELQIRTTAPSRPITYLKKRRRRHHCKLCWQKRNLRSSTQSVLDFRLITVYNNTKEKNHDLPIKLLLLFNTLLYQISKQWTRRDRENMDAALRLPVRRGIHQ